MKNTNLHSSFLSWRIFPHAISFFRAQIYLSSNVQTRTLFFSVINHSILNAGSRYFSLSEPSSITANHEMFSHQTQVPRTSSFNTWIHASLLRIAFISININYSAYNLYPQHFSLIQPSLINRYSSASLHNLSTHCFRTLPNSITFIFLKWTDPGCFTCAIFLDESVKSTSAQMRASIRFSLITSPIQPRSITATLNIVNLKCWGNISSLLPHESPLPT